MSRVTLPVGAPERARAGWAVLASLTLAAAFTGVTWWAKETPALGATQPWQDDPYDVLVSFDFVVLPALAAMIAWRALLCRRSSVLPARRLVDVLRACGVLVGVCVATEAGEWTALALGAHRASWTPLTAWQIAGLVAFSAAAIRIATMLRRVSRRVTTVAESAAQPDWMSDAITLGLLVARRLAGGGGALRASVAFFDRRVSGRLRRHPVAAAALLATALALPLTIAKVVLEGYPPLLVLVSFALPAAVLFVFVVVAGGYLRIVSPSWSGVPRWLPVLVIACAAGPTAFAFHDSFPAFDSQIGLNALLFGGGLAGAAVALLVQRVLGRARRRPA